MASIPARPAPPCCNEWGLRLEIPADDVIYTFSQAVPYMGYSVDIEDVQAAAQRLNGVVKRTAVVSSEDLNHIAGREVLLKCENLQHVGAFKFRGASNAVILLGDAADSGAATLARLNEPYGLCFYGDDILLICDHWNNKIRAVKV